MCVIIIITLAVSGSVCQALLALERHCVWMGYRLTSNMTSRDLSLLYHPFHTGGECVRAPCPHFSLQQRLTVKSVSLISTWVSLLLRYLNSDVTRQFNNNQYKPHVYHLFKLLINFFFTLISNRVIIQEKHGSIHAIQIMFSLLFLMCQIYS